jgi:DNA processing protein
MHSLSRAQALMVLNALPHVGPITLRRLLTEFGGDPVAILEADPDRTVRVPGVGAVISRTLADWAGSFDVAREEAWMATQGVSFVAEADPGYPAALRTIHDPPIGLYVKGNYGFDRPAVAIVGSRRTTLYGQAVARRLGGDLARAGFCVVSGLARGIDTAAHEGALEADGLTAAILGTGIDQIYPPENVDLYRRIAGSGVLVSEFPFSRRADRQSFAMRNRIVAGMSAALIVVESDLGGGSMITAQFAADQGRPVFAVPGRIDQPSSAGCHQLIKEGATLLTGIDDVLAELHYLEGLRPEPIRPNAARGSPGDAGKPLGLSEDETAVWSRLADGSVLTADDLALATGLAVGSLSAVLLRLELRRLVTRRADGRYESSSPAGVLR